MYIVTAGSFEKMKSETVCDVLKRKQTDRRLKLHHQYRRQNSLNTEYDKNNRLHSTNNARFSINLNELKKKQQINQIRIPFF